jgi:hypothetical protein
MPFQRGLSAALTSVAALAAACDRKHPEPAPPPAPALAPAPVEHACQLAPIPLKVAPTGRVVAIGDLHGDFDAARDVLRAAGVLGADGRWSGGTTTLVQTGDVLDRGDGESKILSLLEQLADEAPKAGGQVVQLLGNHELMNAAHDFRYVTPGGAQDFDGDRAHELGPGGVWAKRLAHHNVIAIVGDTVFSHAGVLPAWADALDRVNLDARCWLDGDAAASDPPAALTSDESPVWTRAYGGDAVDCAVLKDALAKLGAKRMVVGHTVQPPGINAQCDGALWRIDVGMSKAYGGPIQALELGEPEGQPKVLTGSREP